MDQVYANSYSIITSETEVFLKFRTVVPEYDLKGNYIADKAEKEVTVVLTHGGLDAFLKMLNKQKEGK